MNFWLPPFGLATAPLEFTAQATEVRWIATELGFHINQYLDAWIDRCLSFRDGCISVIKLLHLLLYLGFVPNFEKCELVPAQRFDFVGTHYSLDRAQVCPTDSRTQAICKATDSFMQSRFKTARQFMSIIGLLNSTFLQVEPMGRMHIRPLQWQLLRNWSQGQSFDKLIPVTPSLSKHLKWWNSRSTLQWGTTLHPPRFEVQVFTDASSAGWGPIAKEKKSKAYGRRRTYTSTLTCLK